MPRINPVVSQTAYDIVQQVPKMRKGEWVSEAIIEKADREQGNTLIQRIEDLEKRVLELERRLKE